MIRNRFTGYILLAIGIVLFFNLDLLLGINRDLLILVLLLSAGLLGTFISLGKNKPITLFVSAVIFLSGVFFYITGKYVLLNQDIILLPAILFVGGSGFLMLFLDNIKEKVFLITAGFLISLSLILIFISNGGIVIELTNRIILYAFDFWPGLLIMIGFVILAGRYK